MSKIDFAAGDEVRFLDEVGSARVVKMMPDGLVLVKTDDDFEYPVHPNQLVLVKKSLSVNQIVSTEKTMPKTIENTETTLKVEKFDSLAKPIHKTDKMRLSLAFVPTNELVPDNGNLLLQLVNDSEYEVLFQVLKLDDTGLRSIARGHIESGYIEELFVFDRDKLNNLKKLVVHAIFVGDFGMLQRSPVEKHFKTEALVFFTKDNFIANDYFSEPVFFLDVINEYGMSAEASIKLNDLQKLLDEKEMPVEDKSTKFSARKTPEIIEVDLHINALIDNVKGLSNAEILEFQMQHFHKTLTDAMFKKAGKIVFIHGIGNGTLRDKVRESLKIQYKLNFQDASFQEYGFGATMVFLIGNTM